jgi:hypothetical protein
MVVLQDRTNGPIADRAGFFAAGEELARVARAAGARPALYMTWTYREDNEGASVAGKAMTIALAEAYADLGRRIDAPVVPAGLVWQDGLDAGMELYSDVKHQNQAGTYLVACVFYGFLFGCSPEGLGFLHGLPGDQAARLQRFAWESLTRHAQLTSAQGTPVLRRNAAPEGGQRSRRRSG